MAEKVKEGDLVYLEYDGWIKNPAGHEELFDTTSEELAKEHELYDEKRTYGEVPTVVGKERLMKGMDEALIGVDVGKEQEVIIPPEKGMGKRDPKLVELFPIREFHRKEIDPKPGMEVHIRDRHGFVSAVTAGRVRVDFNNPLAGKTLLYKFKVKKKVKGAKAKVLAIIEMDYGGGAGEFKVKVEKGNADIVLPEVCKYDEKWFVSKYKVISDLRDLAGLKSIRFVEEYTKKEKAEAETA
ncbi:MAG: FKBP-type peptidyl-prolyl cis-trans isomerase [Thermoplasmata archaeon]